MRSARLTALTLAALIFILDQASKLYVLYILELEYRGPLTINPYIDLILVWNRGISYGLFQQHADWGRYGLVLLSVGAAIGLTIWLFRTPVKTIMFGTSLLIGGALGNALDRILYGAVVDFVLLHWQEWQWYVFNVADAAIVAGVLLLLYDSLLGESKRMHAAGNLHTTDRT